ncbi:MAG TPA: hypothetical protein VFD74_00075 [Thermoleophilia bacterium]|nr:hypothetical protein [Thermoleophilia bacterium]
MSVMTEVGRDLESSAGTAATSPSPPGPAVDGGHRGAGPAVAWVMVASWVLAAHFLRSFDLPFVLFFLLLPMLLAVRRAWAARIAQVALLFGVFEWVATTARLLAERRATGEPAGRMVLIMAAVIVFTAAAAAALESKGARKRFGLRTLGFFSAGPPSQPGE